MQKLKDLLAIAKKHWVPVLCALIAIASIVASYIPLGGWYEDLKTKLAARVALAGKIDLLSKGSRLLPLLDPNSTEQKPLPQFPAQPVIDNGKKAVGEVANQASNMVDAAVNFNLHIPLVSDALPAGIDTDRRNFSQKYDEATTSDARFLAWPDAAHATRATIKVPPLLAGHRPTAAEIQAAKDKKKAEINAKDLNFFNGQVTPDSQAAADQEYTVEADKVQGQLQQEVAEKIKVYLEPLAYTYDIRFHTMERPPELQDIWMAQLALWIQEDVATGVAFANESAADVKQSPVKRIFKLDLNLAPYVMKNGDLGTPTPAVDAVITKAYNATPSGRVSNAFYDVVGFKLQLDVDATKIPEVLDAIQKSQFLNVINVKSTAQDSAALALDGFIYGPQPIVRLELTCEELMIRTWVDGVAGGKPGLMPPSVRTNITKLSTPAGAPPSDTGGGDTTGMGMPGTPP